jgi:Asp-tRNA(Asn)/Glu-tRNA(Gln) amidotransferase A subunit family amidase
VKLPDSYPIPPLGLILTAEASAAFDELTRSGRDDLLVRQIENAWPNVFRQGQLIPAVEYVRANRIRSLVMQEMDEAMIDVDVFVTPSFGGDQLLLTNLTGHPAIALPNGHRSDDGTPTSITYVGRLFAETDLLNVASRWQEETGYHRKRPTI